MALAHRLGRKARWHRADDLVANAASASENEDAETSADESSFHVGSTSTQQPLRGINMNAYPSQPGARQTPRLQNTQKTAVGNGGWGNFGMGGGGGGGGQAGGFGGAPGLGAQQARPSQLSGFAQVIGGGGQQGPIDMSDFPTLSGGPRPVQSNAAAAGWNSNAIRQPSQPTQPPVQPRAPSTAPSQQSLDQFEGQRSQVQLSGRQQSGDDFPPLGGQLNGEGLTQTPTGFTSGLGSPDMQHPRTNGQQAQLPIRENSASYQHAQQPPIGPPPLQIQQNAAPNGQAPPASNVKRYADMNDNEKWGLPGLMAAFEARRQIDSGGPVDDTLPPELRNGMLMGQDLDQLGMDLNQDGPLYTTFTPFPAINMSGSSYDYHDRHMVPDFHLPPGYTVTNVPPLPSRMSAFSDETLFSVFYQHPRDILQEFAAHELVGRDWRWHKVLRQWLQKDTKDSNANSSLPLVDLTAGVPIGSPPQQVNGHSERGVYVFFEANNWRRERREFLLDYEELENKIIPGVAAPGMGLLGGPPTGANAGGTMGGHAFGGQGQGSSQVPGA